MRKIIGLSLVAIAIVALWATPSSATVEFCLGFSNFTNRIRFEATDQGSGIFILAGHDRVDGERAVTGTLYLLDTAVQIGFTSYGAAGTFSVAGTIFLSTLDGPYGGVFNPQAAGVSGTLIVIPCSTTPPLPGR